MDIAPAHQQPATNDDELAKVLAGISGASPSAAQTGPTTGGLEFEETPPTPQPTADKAPTLPQPTPSSQDLAPEPLDEPSTVPTPPLPPVGTNDLDGLKRTALDELRPLVNKLNLPPEEKFDTLLLIIRSTDDQSLLQPAHDTAKLITDDSRRAQALLDIIKEIDYFAANSQQPQ